MAAPYSMALKTGFADDFELVHNGISPEVQSTQLPHIVFNPGTCHPSQPLLGVCLSITCTSVDSLLISSQSAWPIQSWCHHM